MPLSPGARLGPFEVQSAIGGGGMGEVYRARDTRLGRTVAIKVLAPDLASDAEFRARFDREARTISRLSDPHICALFDVGTHDGSDYLVLEYLEGETLAELRARGPLPMDRIIGIGLQICDALATAHRERILHRDVKPGNIMLTKSGVKLLDFGLAKPVSGRPQVGQPSVATMMAPLTGRGTLLGTTQYMAPEQYEGRPADVRADIWAVGCVLYELIAGRRPFDADTTAGVITAVMSSEPPPLPDGAPAALDGVVRGCLEKDPEARWQDIRDVRRALANVNTQPLAVTAGDHPPRPDRRWLAAIMGGMLVGSLALLGFIALSFRQAGIAPAVRFDISAPVDAQIQRFTDTRPYFAVSPDGRGVAFAASNAEQRAIWVKSTGDQSPQLVAGTAGAESLFWSPDGQSIGFVADGQLKRVSIKGGAPKLLYRVGGVGWNATWSDKTILVAEWGKSRIVRISDEGGEPQVVREANRPLAWPHFLPDGRHYLFTQTEFGSETTPQTFVGSLDSADAIPLPGVGSRAEYAAGRLLFWRDGTLLAQSFDVDELRLTGSPTALAEYVHGFAITGFAAFSTAADLLVYQAGKVSNRLTWFDRRGSILGSVGPEADYVGLRLSPDGRDVALCVRDPNLGTNDVWIYELSRDRTRKLTRDRGTENIPVWTPDGSAVVYPANRRGPPSLYVRDASGAGDERALVEPGLGPHSAGSVTTAGQVLYSYLRPDTLMDIFKVPLDGSGRPLPVVQGRAREFTPIVSPDSRWLAYTSDEAGQPEVYIRPLEDARGRRQVSVSGGSSPRWRRDAREMFYVDTATRERIYAVDIALSGAIAEPGVPRLLFTPGRRVQDFDVTADGERFLITGDSPREAGPLSVVLNWTSLVK